MEHCKEWPKIFFKSRKKITAESDSINLVKIPLDMVEKSKQSQKKKKGN